VEGDLVSLQVVTCNEGNGVLSYIVGQRAVEWDLVSQPQVFTCNVGPSLISNDVGWN
jgi:hypothetical protein